MSLVYTKDKEFHIHTTSQDIGEYVILPGDPARCQIIAEQLDNPVKIAQNREFVTYTGSLCGKKVSVTSTGIGGPSAAIAMEELIHCGAHTFIRVGTSGGMQPHICGGDLVIASGAIRAEGTTKEYAPVEFPAVAHFEVVSALHTCAKQMGLTAHVGVVQSKDNFYGQHSPETMPVAAELQHKWDAWIACGALASEMESAALFVVGNVRRVRVGAVLLVIANQTRRQLGMSDAEQYDTLSAVKLAVAAMRKLITDDEKNA